MSLNAVVASLAIPLSEGYFSWNPCAECGDQHGGTRFDIIYKTSLDGDTFFAVVCETCYVELCS